MTLPVMSSGRSLLQFRVLGVPVHVDPSFLVLFLIFGFASGFTAVEIVIWILLAGVSILVHEMGHALVARTTGAEPVVLLHGMGGLTSWAGSRSVSRSRMIAISATGPACGVLVGLGLKLLQDSGAGAGSDLVHFALREGVWINLGWGLLNLLPILPLDGGQVLRDLLPGDLARRQRIAAAVSIATGGAAAALAFASGLQVAGLLAAYFAVTNLGTLQGSRRRLPPDIAALHEAERLMAEGSVEDGVALARRVADHSDLPSVQLLALQVAASGLLTLGRPGEAKHLLLDLPVGSVDPVLEGQVLADTGHLELGLDRLRAAYAASPDERSAYTLARTLAAHGRSSEVLSVLSGPAAPPEIVLAAASGAEAGGAPDVAAGLRAALAGR